MSRAERADAPPGESDEATAGGDSGRFPSHVSSRGASFRRRHRIHGPFALYGGRIDPGKGCEELIEYFSTYVNARRRRLAGADGVEADAAARGAVHQLRGHAVGTGAAPGTRGGDGGRVPVAVRKPVADRARSAGGRHADPLQRPQRRAGRPLPAQQRRPVLPRPRRVRRVHETAGRRRAPQGGDGPLGTRVRAAELPMGRGAGKTGQDDRETGQDRDRSNEDRKTSKIASAISIRSRFRSR